MQRAIQYIVLAGLLGFVVVFVGRGLVALTGEATIVGQFGPDAPRGGCPQTDNCVSSYATEQPWAIDPLPCDADPATALAVATEHILDLGDVEQVGDGQFIAYSRIFRFPDDVRIEASSRGVEVLSSSRLGAGDLGVNRNRVEVLREEMLLDPRC